MLFNYLLLGVIPQPPTMYRWLRKAGLPILTTGTAYEDWHTSLEKRVAPWLLGEARRLDPQLDLEHIGLEVAFGQRPSVLDHDFTQQG